MKKFFSILLIIFVVFVFLFSKNVKKEDKMNIPKKKILVAFFSRTGEQYAVGNIDKGNTAILAEIISKKLNAEIFEIKVKNDNYPKDYNELTEFAKNEKAKSLRPEIIGKVENFDTYDTIFIGYPNWWGDMPMPVYTFLESYDFTGKKIIPFCTHESSGLGTTPGKLQKVVKGKVLNGFGLYGHIAQNDREETESKVNEWLKNLNI